MKSTRVHDVESPCGGGSPPAFRRRSLEQVGQSLLDDVLAEAIAPGTIGFGDDAVGVGHEYDPTATWHGSHSLVTDLAASVNTVARFHTPRSGPCYRDRNLHMGPVVTARHMSSTAAKQAIGSLRILITAKAVVTVVALTMVLFMIGNPDLYPIWTVIMIAAIGLFTVLSLYRDLTALFG